MRKTLFPSITGVIVFISVCLFFACQRENISVQKESSGSVQTNTVVDPCTTCHYEDLRKTVGQKEVVGTVAVCQTATELTITFTVSGELEDAWFNQTGIRIDGDGTGFVTLNPGAIDRTIHHGTKIRSFTHTVLLSDIVKDVAGVLTPVVAGDLICIAAYAVVLVQMVPVEWFGLAIKRLLQVIQMQHISAIL